jgi:DNA mismatch repair ATPase MutL
VRFVAAILWAPAAFAAAPDPHEIIQRAVSRDDSNEKAARNYTFLERMETRFLDSHGKVTKTTSRTYDVTMLEGSPYRRLVEKNDQPLPPDEENKEQQKLDRSIQERLKESQEQRQKRLSNWQKDRDRDRRFIQEIPDAYTFALQGEESIDGHSVFVISATPRPEFRAKDQRSKILGKFKGKFWIAQSDYQLVKVEAEVVDNVNIGWFLIRLAKGGTISLEQTRVNDEVWLIRRISMKASAKLGLVKQLRIEQDIAYRNYRKFQADSRIVDTAEP